MNNMFNLRERKNPVDNRFPEVKVTSKKTIICEVCGSSCTTKSYNIKHGVECTHMNLSMKNRGTIKGCSSYFINMTSGVLFQNNGKMMKVNINARGNRVVNLTNDEGKRVKINLDREWNKLQFMEITEPEAFRENRVLKAEIYALKHVIADPTHPILKEYLEGLSTNTIDNGVIWWVNYIHMHSPESDRNLIKEVVITLKTGV